MKKSNNDALDAAHDFRAQQQKRFSKTDPKLSIEKGIELLPAFLEHVKPMFPELTKEELLDHIKAYTPQTEYDEPFSGERVDSLRGQIEAAAETLGFNLRDGVSAGAMDSDGYEAMQQSVMLTKSSIILLTSNLLIMINRLAKLLSRSLPIDILENDQFRANYEINEAKKLLLKDEELQHAWTNFFADYAMSPENPFHGNALYVIGKERQTLWEDFSDAIDLFVVGHEYGHHIDGHSLGGTASVDGENQEEQHQKELNADLIGSLLASCAGQIDERPNWCALTNIGSVAILTVLDLIRQGNHILSKGTDDAPPNRKTHPPLEKRLDVIRKSTTIFFGEKDPTVALAMQKCVYDMLIFIWGHVKTFLLEIHANGTRPVVADKGGWLP